MPGTELEGRRGGLAWGSWREWRACLEQLQKMQDAQHKEINVLKEAMDDQRHKKDYLKVERDTQREEINNLNKELADNPDESVAAPNVALPASAQVLNEIDHPKEGCDLAGLTAGGSGAAPFDVQHPRARDAAAPLGRNEIGHPLALAPQGCEHMGAGTLFVPQHSQQLEGHELEMDSWLAHLQATLFSQENNATWTRIQRHLWQNKKDVQSAGEHDSGVALFIAGVPLLQPGGDG